MIYDKLSSFNLSRSSDEALHTEARNGCSPPSCFASGVCVLLDLACVTARCRRYCLVGRDTYVCCWIRDHACARAALYSWAQRGLDLLAREPATPTSYWISNPVADRYGRATLH